MIQAKCIEKFRDEHNKIYGYRLQDINEQTQDVTPSDLKSAILNNQISVTNLTLTSDGRLIDKKPEKQLQNTKIMPNTVQKPSGKIKKPYDSESYSEFIKRLACLVEKTFGFNNTKDKLNFGSFSIDPDTKEFTWIHGVMGDFLYKDIICYIELDYTYDVDTKDGVILFDVMAQYGNGHPEYTFKYEFDSINMKAHFSKILKETQQFIYHVKNNWKYPY